jgi:D-serine deaminase-like pyridoxal phosphate-dependent protein
MPELSHALDISAAGTFVGRPVGELVTPALVLDIDAANRNISSMAQWLSGRGTRLRPHVKVHKVPQLAALQVRAGAVGVATATVWEARAMAEGGIEDVMIANEVFGEARIAVLAELAGRARLSVLVDDEANARDLARAAHRAGNELGMLVDLDVGMRRCGVREPDEAVALTRVIAGLPGARFMGVMGYEGHVMTEPDAATRRALQAAAMDLVTAHVEALSRAGFPCAIVAGGGTGTYHLTGAHPTMTELHAGSYVVMDTNHTDLIPGSFEVAMHVHATVINRRGDNAVLDSGRKAVSSDMALPAVAGGQIATRFVAEEHLGIRLPAGAALGRGDRVLVVAGYAPTTVNLYGVMFVSSRGIVVDAWPIRARHGTADTM